MLDRDLAELYGLETRVLNQAVSRNIRRFSEDFMFTITREEIMRISQYVTSLEENLEDHDEQIVAIFEAIKLLLGEEEKPGKKIGYIKEFRAKYDNKLKKIKGVEK